MAQIKFTCPCGDQRITIWGTHDDLVVQLTTERLARAARCHTCGELLHGWKAVRKADKSKLQGCMMNRVGKDY